MIAPYYGLALRNRTPVSARTPAPDDVEAWSFIKPPSLLVWHSQPIPIEHPIPTWLSIQSMILKRALFSLL